MASSAEVTKLALVAGEVSGDLLAARLMAGLKPHLPDVSFSGIGGPRMLEQGLASDVPMDTLTVRGLLPVLLRYRELKGIQNRLRDRLLAERPAAFIGADYPGFNLGLEEQLRAAGIPTVHFVGPQIWAWRGGRIKKIRRAVSHMLVIFPFEEEIYQKAGVPVTYIGHPLAETIPLVPDVLAARRQLGLPENARVVTVMPGSRMSEIKYLTEPYVRTVQLLAARDPSVRFIAPMAGERQKAYFMELVAKAGLPNLLNEVPLQLVDGESHACIAAADAVLAASGTATLEVALYKKPMVIAYKVLQAEWLLIRNMGYLPWIGLPNILARDFVVPEFLQHAATPEALAEAVWFQLTDENNRVRLQQRFTEMHHSLLRDSARESARAVLEVIGKA
ncbi:MULTISPECIES: lipid-A-disaccharide synthase [Massilia]|uniref:Lipid-A-disaccharide synthase n=1 Tax=Massilia orientalis TaxID=3050128 RepID=A0ACC7MA84_9BURK|nr:MULTISPECIES: lipid-A-disaccharide synthase [unclassified Massilia]KQX98337.1 lipid-A-disaccharide synthase [Massilia sp. Root133]KQZ47022.1 lipid-A-disaccharide synthase [Massilia sp. Root1485]MDN4041005.1 lipid-A-disaccharide synthase [Massilia sp. YIM B02787]